MKFVYVDESGSSGDPFLVFFGIEVDAYRLRKAQRDIAPILDRIHSTFPEHLPELKSSRLVNGVGGWRSIDPEYRKSLFLELCQFPDSFSHTCYAYVLDTKRYKSTKAHRPDWAPTPWLSAAMALVAAVQHRNRRLKKNKGQSVLVFDDNQAEIPALTTRISNQPADFSHQKGADPFGAIVDTAFSIRSEHSTLVQAADACAYAMRRHAELLTGTVEARWKGEELFIREAVSSFTNRVVRAKLDCRAASWITSVACDLEENT